MDENKKFAEIIKARTIQKLGKYTENQNPNIMYMLLQERSRDRVLESLFSDFSFANSDMERLDIVEKILFQVTDAKYVSNNFYRNHVNSQYFFVLEVLDILSFISFSVIEIVDKFSDLELSSIVNSEFEELKFNLFILLLNLENQKNNLDIKCTPESVINMFETISLIDKKQGQELFYEFTNVIEKFDLLDQDKIDKLKNSDKFLFGNDMEINKINI